MRIRFRFRWIPFIAAMLAVMLGLSLGQWQLRRADEKRAIEARLAAREKAAPVVLGGAPLAPREIDELEYRPVLVRGEFRADWPVYLDNRPHNGVAGFHVLMPLKIAGSDTHVLVARGWLPRNPADRTRIAPYATPRGQVEVQGVARRDAGHVMQLGSAAPLQPGVILQNVDTGALAQAGKFSMLPIVIEQTGDATNVADGLVRDWQRPSSGVDKHLGYAFQWFALAATAFIFFMVTGFRSAFRDDAAR
jgi:cytochrome oxidase assembly protein ShyY1